MFYVFPSLWKLQRNQHSLVDILEYKMCLSCTFLRLTSNNKQKQLHRKYQLLHTTHANCNVTFNLQKKKDLFTLLSHLISAQIKINTARGTKSCLEKDE